MISYIYISHFLIDVSKIMETLNPYLIALHDNEPFEVTLNPHRLFEVGDYRRSLSSV